MSMKQETGTDRLKRIRMRCWHRGTKEMDLLMGPFSDALLAGEVQVDLDMFERFMAEHDQDLYSWITGTVDCPTQHREMMGILKGFHQI